MYELHSNLFHAIIFYHNNYIKFTFYLNRSQNFLLTCRHRLTYNTMQRSQFFPPQKILSVLSRVENRILLNFNLMISSLCQHQNIIGCKLGLRRSSRLTRPVHRGKDQIPIQVPTTKTCFKRSRILWHKLSPTRCCELFHWAPMTVFILTVTRNRM